MFLLERRSAETEMWIGKVAGYVDSEWQVDGISRNTDVVIHHAVEIVESFHSQTVIAEFKIEWIQLQEIVVDRSVDVHVPYVDVMAVGNQHHPGDPSDELVLVYFQLSALHRHVGMERRKVEIHVGEEIHSSVDFG